MDPALGGSRQHGFRPFSGPPLFTHTWHGFPAGPAPSSPLLFLRAFLGLLAC